MTDGVIFQFNSPSYIMRSSDVGGGGGCSGRGGARAEARLGTSPVTTEPVSSQPLRIANHRGDVRVREWSGVSA